MVIMLVVEGIGEVDWQRGNCRCLLSDVVPKNAPSGFSCSKISAVPIFFDFVNQFFAATVFILYAKFCTIRTCDKGVVEYDVFVSLHSEIPL